MSVAKTLSITMRLASQEKAGDLALRRMSSINCSSVPVITSSRVWFRVCQSLCIYIYIYHLGSCQKKCWCFPTKLSGYHRVPEYPRNLLKQIFPTPGAVAGPQKSKVCIQEASVFVGKRKISGVCVWFFQVLPASWVLSPKKNVWT